jgi:hypothetical protein
MANPGNEAFQPTIWAMCIQYIWDFGLTPMVPQGPIPTSSYGPFVEFVRRQIPHCAKIVSFTVSALGGKPPIPSSAPSNPNEVLIAKQIQIVGPGYGLQNLPVVMYVGVYSYVLQAIPTDADILYGASFPGVPDNVNIINLVPADFQAVWLKSSPPNNFNGGGIGY